MKEVTDFEKNNLTTKLVENGSFRSIKEENNEMFKLAKEKFDVEIDYEIDE